MNSAPSAPPIPSPKDHPNPPIGFIVWLRNKLLAGLALTLPLAITFLILRFVYELLHGLSVPLMEVVVEITNDLAGRTLVSIDDANFKTATRFIGVLIPLFALIALGIMATNVIGVRIVAAFDRLLLTIPFVSFIYKSLRQVIDSFKSLGNAGNFKRVVYVDYPVPGLRMIGFVTGQFSEPSTGKAMTTVFMPTAPNPTTGILLVVDSDKLTDAALSLEEAMKMIFSGGLVAPQSHVAPLNQRSDSSLEPALLEMMETDSESSSTSQLASLPAGLPRAEDFDSGDPDILSSADELTNDGGEGTRGPLSRVLPWKRRR